MKTITLTLILIITSFGFYAQEFEVPKNYKLDKAEDYASHEDDIIKCIDWLMKTPFNEQTKKRNEANAFLIKWLSGSPNVHIEIKTEIVTFIETSPDLLMIFLGGWGKYSLESKDFDNKIEGSKAGIEAVIEFYNNNSQSLKKDKNVEKYIKMKSKGTLNEFIEKNA